MNAGRRARCDVSTKVEAEIKIEGHCEGEVQLATFEDCHVYHCTVQSCAGGWSDLMIVSFRDNWLRDFFVDDISSKKIPVDLEARLFRKLQMLDDSTNDQDLRIPPSNHYEKLRGQLGGWHSLRVNDQWRLVFKWHNNRGEAADVYLDNHSYR